MKKLFGSSLLPGLVVVIALLTACSSIRISGVEKASDFTISNYKTFGFLESAVGGSGLAENFGPNLEVLKNAIIKQMELKGVTRSQSSPDLIVNIGVMVEVKDQTTQTELSDREMTYIGERNYGWQLQERVVRQYREGSVSVDLVDRSSSKLVWTGTAESVMPTRSKKVPSTIEEGMEELFSRM